MGYQEENGKWHSGKKKARCISHNSVRASQTVFFLLTKRRARICLANGTRRNKIGRRPCPYDFSSTRRRTRGGNTQVQENGEENVVEEGKAGVRVYRHKGMLKEKSKMWKRLDKRQDIVSICRRGE
jgi:hypothetical protein